MVRASATVVAVVAVLLCSAAPSSATLVWSQGSRIVAGDDDAQNPRVLVTAGELGMAGVGNPNVHPSRGPVAFNADYGLFTQTCPTPEGFIATYHGLNATGVYRWAPGEGAQRVTDLDPLPYSESGSPGCGTSAWLDPAPDGAGNVFSILAFETSNVGYRYRLHVQPLAARTRAREYDLRCRDSERLWQLAVDPTTPTRVAIAGCGTLLFSGVEGQTTENGATLHGSDDAVFKDPSFRSDGKAIVDVEAGGSPGLWINGATATDGPHEYLLSSPEGVTFSSPRFMGVAQDQIVFTARRVGDEPPNTVTALFRVPAAGCTPAPCAFPDAARQLTEWGNNQGPAWTTDPLTPPPGAPAPAPGGGAAKPTVELALPSRVRWSALTRGVPLTLTVDRAGPVRVSATVPASKVRAKGRTTTVAAASGRAKKAGNVTVKLRWTAVGKRERRKLRGATLTLKAIAGSGKTAATVTRRVKLR